MKNKIELKKYMYIMLITVILLTILFILINNYEYKTYINNYNHKIAEILNAIKEEYPNIEEAKLINILNSKNTNNNISVESYGIDITKDDLILKNNIDHNKFKIINISYILASFLILIVIFIIYIYRKNKKIIEITKLIEKINRKNYELDIDNNTEDELSILKSELYKTTIMLKEQAENAHIDKINLKNSLEDISHQLKTPITSIIISLDNIIDNPEMDENTKMKFIQLIKREINNINFLVASLLKLSKFDANTIEFHKKEVFIYDIIEESIKNVSLICDLKNINIVTQGNKKIKLYCDPFWQIEGFTNILKNAVEHSYDNEKININIEQNKVYTKISINNKGNIIDKKDIKNIFKRFYKAKNSSKDSIGIGLSLSKTIIEKDNGKITVTSNELEGTTFIIKFFKNEL